MVERAGAEARFVFKAHPHMLWHACGTAASSTPVRSPYRRAAGSIKVLAAPADARSK
jgi:hypothetical protein